MIVEDDLDSRQGLSLRLRANGYYVATAADALGALSTALKEHPDLILLDLGLPGGGGRVVLDRLKKNPRLAHIPVIILTGSVSSTEEPPKAIAGYFTKPVDHEALLNAMQKGSELLVKRHAREFPDIPHCLSL